MFKIDDKLIPLEKSSCVFMVCPGDRKFTKANLKKGVVALKLAGFEKAKFLVADGNLQAHNKAVKQGVNPNVTSPKSHKELQDESNQEGKKWADTNESKIKKELPRAEIIHWDDAIANHEDFFACYTKALKLYNNDKVFHGKIEESIKPYLKKYVKFEANSIESKKQHSSYGYEDARKDCIEYKLKEIAGLFRKEKVFTFLAYVGELCPGLQYAFDHFIKDLYYLKINLKSKVQKILLHDGVPLINLIAKEPVVDRVKMKHLKRVASPTIDGNAQRSVNCFIKGDPVFTNVEVRLQNCENTQELRNMLTILQVITAKYMMISSMQENKKAGLRQKFFSKKPFNVNNQQTKVDGGLSYTGYRVNNSFLHRNKLNKQQNQIFPDESFVVNNVGGPQGEKKLSYKSLN
jgi:hypothetical protein